MAKVTQPVLASGTQITPELREAWLEARKTTIGASEAASALGLPDAYHSPLELYMLKKGLLEPQPQNEAMEIGLELEDAIANLYRRRRGSALVSRQVFTRGDEPYPWLSATVDAVTSAGLPVEFKTVGPFSRVKLGEEDSDQLPAPWLIQVHVQMLLMGTVATDVAVLQGGQRFRLFHVRREEGLLDAMLPRLHEFYLRLAHEMPPPAAVPEDAGLMAQLYPGIGGRIALPESFCHLADQYTALGEQISSAEKARKLLKAELLSAMGEAEEASLTDGRVLVRKKIAVKGYTVEPRQDLRFSITKGA